MRKCCPELRPLRVRSERCWIFWGILEAVEDAARCDVRWKTGSGVWGDAVETITNSYTVTGLTPDTKYTVKHQARTGSHPRTCRAIVRYHAASPPHGDLDRNRMLRLGRDRGRALVVGSDEVAACPGPRSGAVRFRDRDPRHAPFPGRLVSGPEMAVARTLRARNGERIHRRGLSEP